MPKVKTRRGLGSTLIAPALPAAVAVALCSATTVLFDVKVAWPFYIAAFSGTYLVYLADRALPFSPEDAVNRGNRSPGVTLSELVVGSAAIVGTASMLPFLRAGTIALATVIGALAFAYVVPIGSRRLKDAGAVKPFLIAAGWSAGAVLLPLVEGSSTSIDPVTVAIFILYRLCFLLPNTLLADLADVSGDLGSGIRTPAGILGGRTTARTAQASAIAAILIAVFGLSALRPLILLDAAVLVIVVGLIHSVRSRHEVWFRTVLDLMMLWPIVLFLAR